MRNYKLLTTVFGLLSLGSIACGSGTQAGDDDGYNGAVSPGSGNSAPDAAVPPGCDVTKTPAQDACVVNETLGVFVAAPSADAGADAAPDGTRAHPFAKMQDAIDAARSQKKRVYACALSYSEQIAFADGVSMFGDLDCDQGWSVSGKHASVRAPASPAARADNIVTATRIEGIDIVAPDGTDISPSSIALVANGSPALTIANATIHAGVGAKGADGVEGAQLTNASSANGQSNAQALLENCSGFGVPNCSGRHLTALAGGSNACVGSPRPIFGGAGGNGGTGIGNAVVSSSATFLMFGGQYYMVPQYPATDGNPSAATATTAAGGTRSNGRASWGQSGATGADGSSGGSATAPGALERNGFTPRDGVAGTDGAPGQGGGGAAGYDYVAASQTSYPSGDSIYFTSGPSGGAGGCPGLAGTAGKGGGASIAIFASDSPLTIDTCIIQASDAGDGGHGTFGSGYTVGGLGGSDDDPNACNPFSCSTNVWHMAGNGGSGGRSGWSGSGAGGSSIGIAFHGAQVILVNAVPTIGNAGHGVVAMTSGSKSIPASTDGASGLSVAF